MMMMVMMVMMIMMIMIFHDRDVCASKCAVFKGRAATP
jgi:hypothetical protein